MKVLYLPLKKEWYEMIERGEKTEEYRERSAYWIARLFEPRRMPIAYIEDRTAENPGFVVFSSLPRVPIRYDAVCFSYGYTKRRMTFEYKGVTIGRGRPEWGAPDHTVFIIKLGRRI